MVGATLGVPDLGAGHPMGAMGWEPFEQGVLDRAEKLFWRVTCLGGGNNLGVQECWGRVSGASKVDGECKKRHLLAPGQLGRRVRKMEPTCISVPGASSYKSLPLQHIH